MLVKGATGRGPVMRSSQINILNLRHQAIIGTDVALSSVRQPGTYFIEMFLQIQNLHSWKKGHLNMSGFF